MSMPRGLCTAPQATPLMLHKPQHVGRHHNTSAAGRPEPRPRLLAALAAAGTSRPSSQEPLDQLEQTLAWQLQERGEYDGEGPDAAHVAALAEAVRWLQRLSVRYSTALQIVLQNEHLMASLSLDAALGPKFALFQRYSCSEAGWAEALAQALQASPGGAALALPLPAFEAALLFAAAQLQQLSRRRYEQLHQPYSLHRFVKLHPEVAGGVLAQHPDAFRQHTAPWLTQQLGWDSSALADAALSRWMPELCRLDLQQAQACVDWLTSLGLTQRQAGQLLLFDLSLLVSSPGCELATAQRRVQELAAAWGTSPALTAALVLAQPWLTAGMADRTAQLVGTLQEYAGMSEGQVLQFVMAGGLDGGSFTRTDAGAARATDRLKQLLMVYGAWPQVAAALCEHPEALSMSWHGVRSLLGSPQQQQVWRVVAAMSAAAEEDQQW